MATVQGYVFVGLFLSTKLGLYTSSGFCSHRTRTGWIGQELADGLL
jgi:hypothetical protein